MLERRRLLVCLGHAVETEMLGHGEPEEDSAIVRYVHDAATNPSSRGDAPEVGAVQTDLSRHRLEKTRDRPQRRGLAGPIGAK